MYLDFFGFSEKPFTITPNPRFIYLSKAHQEVFAHLSFGIEDRCGFIAITGEVGTGKTTVLRTLLNRLDNNNFRLAFIFNPCHSAVELLKCINREFGIECAADTVVEQVNTLNEFLIWQHQKGRTVVLVLDESQNLEPAVLEQIRLLSNLETETDKLIQIVLVGQPELKDMLHRPDLRQLNQRISVRHHLETMDIADTLAYIRHRLSVAGGAEETFSPSAVKTIYESTGGLPRLINVLCGRCLLVAFSQDARIVTPKMVRIAQRELGYEQKNFFRRMLGG